ncbi:MAG: RHS repeat protein [Cyanobacteria bacterium HKST-UBA02]|nr:RHS repeat protein [Cyanobacteria bacterium HKST-UBA02]
MKSARPDLAIAHQQAKRRSSTRSDQATYQYTAQGWLKKVIFANGDTVEYSYDSMGNRTSVVVTIA